MSGYPYPPNVVITSQPTFGNDNKVYPILNQRMTKMEWSQGLCQCCNSPAICLCGMCCFPCLFCQNVSNLGEDVCKFCCLQFICGCPMGIALRALAREKFNIQGNHGEDVVIAQCCGTCNQCQIANEIQVHRM